ncbi:hypothetical protein FIV42_21900 [Persicimonas caeni]|uniref:DUF5666 domain-containing protein n=1 Tax=Persicimonas caeni TaxID=2292766 RepID=A0A4Y6PYR1_PERCE|nr:hypothetical protein [Persicimonas caeni]QDG53299.1 hypothetical protein FIV42_21900 [Persicimonas caeni]QED34521.1 hypothetical protein FRD00_21895 [Persicimonas caeni]
MRRILSSMVLCLLMVPVTAAAQESTSVAAAKTEAEASADDTANQPPNLGGTWAQQVVTTAVSEVPIVGEVVTRTISLQKVDISQTGEKLEMQTEVCAIKVHSSVDVVETHIPKRFVAAMGVVKRPARLVEKDGAYHLHVPRKFEVLGVRLRAPNSENLPTEADDPRVFDQDGDGHPGMTVRVSGLIDGSLYIIHRGWDRLRGKLSGLDHIEGAVQWNLEQVVVDSTSIFLGDPPESRAHPDSKKNHFEMRRVTNGTDCQTIVKRRARLF